MYDEEHPIINEVIEEEVVEVSSDNSAGADSNSTNGDLLDFMFF